GLPQREEVRLQTPLPREPSVGRDQCVRFVDREKGAGRTGVVAERLVKSGLGADDASVRQGRLGENERDVPPRQGGLERRHVVELDDPRLPARPRGSPSISGAKSPSSSTTIVSWRCP